MLVLISLLVLNSVYAEVSIGNGNVSYVLSDGVNYTVVTFIANGTFNVSNNALVDVSILIVGGGGSGSGIVDGSATGGGGGAGGLIFMNANYTIPAGNYNVTVGVGGARKTDGGNNGTNSTFYNLNAKGGGAGGGTGVQGFVGFAGGSGGGGAGEGTVVRIGGSPILNQGTAGGNGSMTAPGYGGGGGGGSNQSGRNGASTKGGDGGNGSAYNLTGILTWYAAGGGGGAYNGNTIGYGGALGGGGNGSGATDNTTTSGVNGTGSGGGGSGSGAGAKPGLGGAGGSGIVIIRYLNISDDRRLTINLVNIVNGSALSGFCINAVGTNTTQNLCNSTGSTISFNTTGIYNITAYNISNSYFNVTELNYNFSSIQILSLYTYQAVLNVSTYRLFLNTSITNFNATLGSVFNTTTNGSIVFQALIGNSSVKIDVAGNYSKNVTCVIATGLQTTYCNATGIYDNLFTIGAKFNNAGISNFTVTVENSTLGGRLYQQNTTNGSIVFPLIQGYGYYFLMNSSAYSLANNTLRANATTNLYNFSLLSYNTFELTFYNESTGNKLNATNITVQLISNQYSNNYTTENGTLSVNALVPEEYTIRYWREADVPREYYVTLTNQSYQNISLFIVDSGISQLYLPIVYNQYSRPLGGARIQLLRAYINPDNTLSYKVVEMTTTDTNGQGVLRVVPNIINYKLLISHQGTTFTTDPTKFTASTNAYTLSDAQSVLTSLTALPYVYTNVTYITGTQTFVFTWVDNRNIVESGCLIVTKKNNTGFHQVYSSCSDGSSGSIPYTVTDTGNFTSYSALGQLNTNTEFSTYPVGPITVEMGTATAAQIFGLVGFIIMLLIVTTVGFMANEHGSDSMVVASLFAFVFVGMVGIIAFSWPAYVGIIILGILIVYKLSRR